MDGIEARAGDVANIVRVQIQSAAGREVVERYGVTRTPTFIVFDRTGAAVARQSYVDASMAERLRALAGAP